MEDELNDAPIHENVIVTRPYKLHCKNVYHIVFPDKGSTPADQVYYDYYSCSTFKVADIHCFIKSL